MATVAELTEKLKTLKQQRSDAAAQIDITERELAAAKRLEEEGDAISQRLKDREKARTANPNPLMTR